MKKIIGLSLCAILMGTNLLAGEKTFNFQPVCSMDNLVWVHQDRYLDLGTASKTTAKTLLDTSSFEIDKKNKTFTGWIVMIERQEGRNTFTSVSGGFDNYGVMKRLISFDYGKQKNKIKQISYYNCDGSSIYSNTKEEQWENLIPGSVDESIFDTIKANLKFNKLI